MTKKLERINAIYQKSSQLSKLSQRVQQLNQLNAILQKVLPPQFAEHCYLANINEHTLVIHTDNASYASLIRFQASALCDAVSKHLPQVVNKLDVRVRPKNAVPQSELSSPSLPNTAAESLQQTADAIEDGPLKEALSRLAQRHNN